MANTGKDDAEVVFDSYGNEIKVERIKTLTDKERKKMIKQMMKKIKEGRKKKNLTEFEINELEDKVFELQEQQQQAAAA